MDAIGKDYASLHFFKNTFGGLFQSDDIGMLGMQRKINGIIEQDISAKEKLAQIFAVLLSRMARFVNKYTSATSSLSENKELIDKKLNSKKHNGARMIGAMLNKVYWQADSHGKNLYRLALVSAAQKEIRYAGSNAQEIIEYFIQQAAGDKRKLQMYPEFSREYFKEQERDPGIHPHMNGAEDK